MEIEEIVMILRICATERLKSRDRWDIDCYIDKDLIREEMKQILKDYDYGELKDD